MRPWPGLASGRVGLVWAEFPGNPLWQVPDLRRLSTLAQGAGALLLVDATAATPYQIRPLSLGADIVLHSATKFLNGHGDVLAGVLALADPAAREALAQHRTDTGTILAPFSEWLLLRGLRTFVLRMERASASAARLAGWLADQGLRSTISACRIIRSTQLPARSIRMASGRCSPSAWAAPPAPMPWWPRCRSSAAPPRLARPRA